MLMLIPESIELHELLMGPFPKAHEILENFPTAFYRLLMAIKKGEDSLNLEDCIAAIRHHKEVLDALKKYRDS